jgi:hypothetical protein
MLTKQVDADLSSCLIKTFFVIILAELRISISSYFEYLIIVFIYFRFDTTFKSSELIKYIDYYFLPK